MGILKDIKGLTFLITFFLGISLYASASEFPSIPFSFENQEVNNLIIESYERNIEAWAPGQLFIVGMCYLHEQRLEAAQKVFERIRDQAPDDFRSLVALGNIYHMMGKAKEADAVYLDAWERGNYIIALKQLAVLRLQVENIKGLTVILGDLLDHQKEHIEIQKVLLAYSLGLDDIDRAGPIFAAVAKSLDHNIIGDNPDLRKLLIMGTLRFRDYAVDSGEQEGANSDSILDADTGVDNTADEKTRD